MWAGSQRKARMSGGCIRAQDRGMEDARQDVLDARRMKIRSMLICEGYVLPSAERSHLEDVLLEGAGASL
jgi:hypothetical protein